MKLSAIIIAVAILLTSCRFVDVNFKDGNESEATDNSAFTTASTNKTTSESSTTAEVTTATEVTTTTEATTSETTTVTQAPYVEPIVQPNFDESFFERLNEIFSRYEINQKCNGEAENCGCNPEYEKKDAEGNILIPRDKEMSIYYYDIESGYELFINGGVHYPVASVVKIPYCIYIYEKLTSGEISPDLVLTYEKRHKFHGTGLVAKGNFGDQYTVLQLLKLAITESDNTAFEMLKDLSTWEDFESYCKQKGMSHPEDTRRKYQKICLESIGASGRLLAEFLRSDSEFIDEFKYDLTHTKNRMIRSNFTVYRKYGWTNYAFHDCAYIEATHPYVLAILTNLEGEENIDYALYKEVSLLIEEYSENRDSEAFVGEAVENNG